MCRQPQKNKFKKCYLKTPCLYTIPEEDHVTTRDKSMTGSAHLSNSGMNSPKGIKRIVNTSYNGNKSPRCSEKTVKDKKRNVMVACESDGNNNKNEGRKPLAKVLVMAPNVGNQSPQTRRVTTERKTTNGKNVTRGVAYAKIDDIVVDVTDLPSGASPKTIKRMVAVSSNLGNQSPNCRRSVPRDKENNQEMTPKRSNSVQKNKVLRSNSDLENVSTSTKRPFVEKPSWHGSHSHGLNIKEKKVQKEKGLFKRMVKFLTVPPKEDFVAN